EKLHSPTTCSEASAQVSSRKVDGRGMSGRGASSYRVKGSTFRAHVKHLDKVKKLGPVLDRLSPQAAQAVTTLPLPTSWLDASLLDEIIEKVAEVYGIDRVLEMERELLKGEVLPFVFPMLSGVMRVLGTSPATLFGKFHELTRTMVQGIEFTYI